MSEGRRIAVVSVARDRPHAPRYHAYSELLASRVVAAVTRTGAEAVRVFAADGAPAARVAVSGASGVVLLGGEDITPGLYGGRGGYEQEGRHDERADEVQLGLARQAVETGVPLLGICRGLQIVNVALGGSLVQHLPHTAGHRAEGPRPVDTFVGHDVDVVRGTVLRALLGSAPVATASAHHQAVDRLADNLVVSATASDGTIEAIEHRAAPVVGVQWHPEAPVAAAGQLDLLLGALDALRLAA